MGDQPCKKPKLESPESSSGENVSAEGLSEPPGVCVACVGLLQNFCDQSYAKQVSKGLWRIVINISV